jgi:hypothetical protein
MSATIHATKNATLMPTFTLRAVWQRARAAIEAHARYRAKSAISPSQCQQIDREFRRYRRLMHSGR